MLDKVKENKSIFKEFGFKVVVENLIEEITSIYLSDQIPWVVGYSGGKDSSAVLQLIWLAVRDLPAEQRKKTIHVISTDTLVEQPLVATWVEASHVKMRKAADAPIAPATPPAIACVTPLATTPRRTT